MQREVTITRIERVNRSGTSKKTGNPYSMDMTNISFQLPISTDDSFGFKEVTYQWGDHTNYSKLISLHGKLPVVAIVDIDIVIDDFGRERTVITDVKLAKAG